VDQNAGLIFLALPLLLIYLVFSRTKRQQRILAAAQASVRPGLRVMTTSGLHATVVSADDDDIVVLEIAPGVSTRWARQAIAQVFDDVAADADPAAVLDLASGGSETDREPAVREPTVHEPPVGDRNGKHDDNTRSDDDRDNRTLT
jgi:preprotein translocase subunit YajC